MGQDASKRLWVFSEPYPRLSATGLSSGMEPDQPLRSVDKLSLPAAKYELEASRIREATTKATSAEVRDRLFDIAAQYEQLARTVETQARLYSGLLWYGDVYPNLGPGHPRNRL